MPHRCSLGRMRNEGATAVMGASCQQGEGAGTPACVPAALLCQRRGRCGPWLFIRGDISGSACLRCCDVRKHRERGTLLLGELFLRESLQRSRAFFFRWGEDARMATMAFKDFSKHGENDLMWHGQHNVSIDIELYEDRHKLLSHTALHDIFRNVPSCL